MKSTVSNTPCTKENPFPKLMKLIGDDNVVLFHKPSVGMVVSGGFWPIGTFKDTWIMDRFANFNGSVCLEND